MPNHKLSLLTMSHGNAEALRRTLESFKDVVDEVIYGDLIIFPEDREIIKGYAEEYNMKIITYPFNFIFKNGFSVILNNLASHAKNEWVLYMNCSEIVDGEQRILGLMDYFEKYNFNCYPFDHAQDKHTWFRMYKKSELFWSGPIHEDLSGERRPASHYIFRMADTEKDNNDKFKARCLDSVKECVYFNQYKRIIEDPSSLGATNIGWVKFAQDNYQSFIDRLEKKGKLYSAFGKGNYELMMEYFYTDQEFKTERFESSLLIEYQNDKKYLL